MERVPNHEATRHRHGRAHYDHQRVRRRVAHHGVKSLFMASSRTVRRVGCVNERFGAPATGGESASAAAEEEERRGDGRMEEQGGEHGLFVVV